MLGPPFYQLSLKFAFCLLFRITYEDTPLGCDPMSLCGRCCCCTKGMMASEGMSPVIGGQNDREKQVHTDISEGSYREKEA